MCNKINCFVSANFCKEKWTRIRDNYRKALKLRHAKIGKAATKIKPAKFEKELSFLIPYFFDLDTKQSSTSPPISSEGDIETSETSNNCIDIKPEILLLPKVDREISAIDKCISETDGASHPKKRKGDTYETQEDNPAIVSNDHLNRQEDPLTNFFVTMAQIVKTFPVLDQIEIKRKIFHLITETEIKLASSSCSIVSNGKIT